MNNKIIGLFIILVFASAFFLPAHSEAEIIEGTFDISPFVGYCTGATSHDLCHKDVYGLRLGYVFTPHWEAEAAFEGVGTSAATMFHADVLYHFMPDKSFNPFIIAGIGEAHVRPIRGNAYDTLMADIGVGLKYQLSRIVSFRTEIRDVMTHFQNSIITAGLTFSIGKRVHKPAAEVPPPAAPEKEPSRPAPSPTPEVQPAPSPTPAPAPETKAEPAPAAPEEIKVVLEDVHFNFNRSSLTKTAKKILDNNIEIISANPNVQVRIEGYSCAHGNAKHDMRLSKKRALTVKKYLVKHGVHAQRLSIAWYGKKHLLVPETPTKHNKNSEEAKENRRVHFEVFVK